jgi:phosphoribosylamine--glycine ligase
MARHGIPTALYAIAHTAGFAIDELESGDLGDASVPIVVKADGLAAGKGVVVADKPCRGRSRGARDWKHSRALTPLKRSCSKNASPAGSVAVDVRRWRDFALMPPTRDHKRLGDGDTGP